MPKIKHVVVILQENHTYDSYFGRLGRGNGVDLGEAYTASDPPKLAFPWDPTHGHNFSANHRRWNDRHEQFDHRHLPLYYDWAGLFPVLDDFYSEIDGPSDPNHSTLWAADSGGMINNPSNNPILIWLGRVFRGDPKLPRDSQGEVVFDLPTICSRLEAKGLTWKNYGDGSLQHFADARKSPNNLFSSDFIADARQGKLPNYCVLHPDEFSLNEHTPDRVADGMKWTAQQIEAIIEGGLWDETAVFIVWDDWGGYYDHLSAPYVESWEHDQSQQYRYGPRVPCMVLSPYAKPRYVSSSQGVERSFVSILRFTEKLFGLEPLNHRDATANDLWDCFDFDQAPLLPPRTSLRPGELPPAPKQSMLRRVTVEPVVLYLRVTEALVRTGGGIPLEILCDRMENHLPRLAAAIRNGLGLDEPQVGKFSRSGMPSTLLGRVVLVPPAAAAAIVATPISAFASFLMNHGLMNAGRPDVRMAKSHRRAVEEISGRTSPRRVDVKSRLHLRRPATSSQELSR